MVRLAPVQSIPQLRQLLRELRDEGWLEVQAPALRDRLQQQPQQPQEEEEAAEPLPRPQADG